MTGANVAAVDASVNRTLAEGPMAAHSAEAAAIEPPYVADAPTPRNCTRLASFATPDESAEAAEFRQTRVQRRHQRRQRQREHAAGPDQPRAAREAPRVEARDVSHD